MPTFLQSLGERFTQVLPSLEPYIWVIIGLLVILILARLLVVLIARKRISDPAAESDEDEARRDGASEVMLSGIPRSFSKAMERLRELMRKRGYHFDWFLRFIGHRYRYEVPWVAVIGEEGSGKTTMLQNVGLDTPVAPLLADPPADATGQPVDVDEALDGGCNWWFYNQALVIDVPGHYFLRTDGQDSERGWRMVLRQLRKKRSRQPLNAIVLALPCSDLMGENALSKAEIERKAGRMYNRLNEMQKALGLRLPVYVVLTKADDVPGFRAFCDDMPNERWGDILGWSNPYSVEAVYTEGWIDEAFGSIREDMHYAQLRALSDGLQTDAWDSIFLLSDFLQQAREPLTAYMNELFRESAYSESFVLRGLYLSGSPTPPSAPGAAQANRAEDREPVPIFTHDLFRDKIFREDAVVQPLASARGWQQRATRAVQVGVAALAIFSAIGLWNAGDNLAEKRRTMMLTLEEAQRGTEQANRIQRVAADDDRQRNNDPSASGGLSFQRLSSLLERTAQASDIDLSSWLIPASWISDVQDEFDAAIAATYDQVILQEMSTGLKMRTEALVDGGQVGSEPAGPIPSSLQDMSAYRDLYGYSQELAALEQASLQYNRMIRQPDLDDFASVTQYLFDVQIRDNLSRAPEVYRKALASADADSFNVYAYRPEASTRMRQYALQFNDALPQKYGMLIRLEDLSGQIDQLGTASASAEAERFRFVRNRIARVESMLQSQSQRWVTSDSLAMAMVYGPILAYADTSSLMADGVADALRGEGRAAINRFQDRLGSIQSSMTGPLLERTDGQVQRALSSRLVSLQDGLGTLLNQSFMQRPEQPQPFRDNIPNGRRLAWGMQELQSVRQHIATYDSLVTQGFPRFTLGMQRTIRRVASTGLRGHLMPHLARAQSFPLDAPTGSINQQEREVQARARQFRRAVEPLNMVLTVQDGLGMERDQRRLVQVMAAEAVSILKDLDQLLANQSLYNIGPDAFAKWQGQRPPNLAVVSARDSQAVSRYLTTQRERMKFLAQTLAGPPLSFLDQWNGQLGGADRTVITASDRSLIAKWRGISRELEKYEIQTAGNTLSIFEDYLKREIYDVDPVSFYLETSEQEVARQSSDFFLRKRDQLRRRLYERSRALAIQEARRQYQLLQTQFNETLAGRFPFASVDAEDAPLDVAPSTVRRFYRAYDAFAVTYQPVLKSVGMPKDVERFLDQVDAIRPLFGAAIDYYSTYPLPTIDVDPQFRVNRNREVGGQQIIDWSMRIARETATYGRPDTLYWAAGDPVSIQLRWAANAPTRPTDAERGTVEAASKTVTYRYNGQWALLRLMRNHTAEAEDFRRRVDANPYTLRFTAAVDGSDADASRVFVRLRLFHPETSERISFRTAFPQRAPALSETSPSNENASAPFGN